MTKRRFISTVLAACMLLTAMPFASADEVSTEISFRVGDSILSINGVSTEVETPYVAGEGTTLVPLRVITEAFGAQVDWDAATRTITLSYTNVNIILQLDNSIAQVNDHSETLPEAPALSQNGVTMVPLRFLSETFGADVSYEAETGAILVTKKTADDSSTVVGITDMKRTGDSYYKWSIDTPSQMQMTDRRADGLSTNFTADDESSLCIDIYNIDEDTPSFDEEYANMKDSFSGYTLVNAEKLTDSSGNKWMHFQGKSKTQFIDYREYYTKKYQYCITSEIVIAEDETIKNMILSISDSFQIGSTDQQTYDLSTVHSVEGREYRTVNCEDYNATFDVPANYMMRTSGIENEFHYLDTAADSHAYVFLGIYSKSDTVTAKQLAELDRESRASTSNPALVTLSEIISTGNGAYRYTQTISGSTNSDTYNIDTFFEKGDYVYNFSITQNGKGNESVAEYILGSLKTDVLDSSKVGKILRNDSDDTDITVKVDNYKFMLPAAWKITSTSPSDVICLHDKTLSGILASVIKDSSFKKGEISRYAGALRDFVLSKTENGVVEQPLKYQTINGRKFAHFTYKNKTKDSVSYASVYLVCENGKAIILALMQDETSYNSKEIDMFTNAVNSFTEQ